MLAVTVFESNVNVTSTESGLSFVTLPLNPFISMSLRFFTSITGEPNFSPRFVGARNLAK